MVVDPDILPTFLDEAEGYVAVLRRPDAELAARRQAAHGLKGAASMLGLTELAQCAAALEDRLGQGDTAALPEALATIEAQLTELGRQVGRQTGDFPPPAPAPADAPADEAADEDWDPETAAMLRELFVEEASEHLDAIGSALLRLQRQPDDRTPLQEMLRKAHTLKGSASTVGLPVISEAAHLLEDLLVELQRQRLPVSVDRLDPAVELLRTMAEGARGGDADQETLGRFRTRLHQVTRTAVSPDGGEAPRGERSPPAVTRPTPLPPEAAREWTQLPRRPLVPRGRDRRSAARRQDDALRVRVDVSRLDDLMNTVGELVIQRTRIEQRVDELKGLARDMSVSRQDLHAALAEIRTSEGDPALTRIREVDVEVADAVANLERTAAVLEEDSEVLRRTSHTLQESLTQVRMMPIRWLHARLQRPIRELAASQGKLVALTTDDESTEMDRLVIEQITDPLIHLIRNAVAHGIESPEERARAGKPQVGQIRVSARHHGDMVLLEVEDDGGGIDPVRLREALEEQGTIPAGLGDRDVLETIFATGFTTRRQADRVAGRGMGLDVVQRNISGMGGDIRVSSAPGKGTRFMIQIPIATAIIQALLFKVGEPVYAIPVAYVRETLFVEPQELQGEAGLHRVRARDRWLPLLHLHQLLGGDPPRPLQDPGLSLSRQPVIVLQYGDIPFGVTCTRVVGPREIVLKQLGPLLAALPLFAGATISGSSKVQFVLDVASLARVATMPPVEPPAGAETGRQADPEAKRILVVDDSRSVRAAVSHILRAAGYSVDVAADGWEAWERLQLRSYDLLITDLEMPRLHGHELIARCRRHHDLARLAIVVLTSRTAEHNRASALARGADGFVAKPINRRLILAQLAQLLEPNEDQQ